MTGLQTGVAGGATPPLLAAVALALVHVLGGGARVVTGGWTRRSMSAAGGASVAYVFVLLLPEVSEAALAFGTLRGETLLAEQAVYLAALAGFVAFYGVEVGVGWGGDRIADSPAVFRSHLLLFTVYSAVIAFLLGHQEVPGARNLVFYTLAMALHFLITDHGLRRHHGAEFDRTGRWLLALGTLAGGVVGVAADVAVVGVTVVFGFVAGAVVLNVLKEELPGADEGRFVAFALGALAFAALVLAT